jgi:hypothetical protein
MDAADVVRSIVIAVGVVGAIVRIVWFVVFARAGRRAGWQRWKAAVICSRAAVSLASSALLVAIGAGHYQWPLAGIVIVVLVLDRTLRLYVKRSSRDVRDPGL